MEVKFEVLVSSSIKRKKPWPRFCWLGKEKEGVFLLDDNRISEISLRSGQTKKKIPKLQQLLPNVLTMSSSQNGIWLAGILVSGEVFLWNRDKDSLKMVPSVPAVYELTSAAKANSRRLSLLVSGDGRRVLVASLTGQLFLWECLVPQELNSFRDNTVKGRWSQIAPSETSQLPSVKDKEACLHCVFVQSQAVGDVCLSAFVFTIGEHLIVTFLKIQWEETWQKSLKEYSVNWVTKSYPLGHLVPPCRPVKSRGALVPAFSPDGQLFAIILNQKDPRATQALFISVQNFVTVSSSLGGCGSKKFSIPPKYVRSYWVSCASWTPEGLYLVCILKRGSVLMLARLGGLVSLSTSGCDIEFGPAHFLPLHPLVTYRPPVPSQPPDDALSSSSVSLRDPMRQRYSVTWHPRLPCLIVSDGYMVTALNMSSRPASSLLMSSVLMETTQALERLRKIIHSELPQVKSRLESMSTLKFTASLLVLKERETPESMLPLFLRSGRSTGGSRLMTERIEDDDGDDSDDDHCAGSVMQDGGRLEFASMFDTLHAQSEAELEDSDRGSSALLEELTRAQRSLLTAWALGVSLGGAMDQRERMLKYTVTCAVRLARLLWIANPLILPYKQDGVFEFFRSLLSFLPWDSSHQGGTSCLGVVLDLARRFVNLFLPSSLHAVCSSQNFMAALFVLRAASKVLDQTHSLSQKAVQREKGPPCPSDIFSIPLLQDDEDAETVSSRISDINKPSVRLVEIWREIYGQALQFQNKLRSDSSLVNRNKELENMSKVISQIQESLQKAGDDLEEGPALYSITGEEHFISGEYSECIQVWRDQLWEERARAGPRTVFLETRYCLALLFGQLFQYRLREAQALCDAMVKQLLTVEDIVDETPFELWLPQRVNSEAACAVVQSLGRFMASYFTNQPLVIFPPHNVDVLPPLHLPQLTGQRTVALCQRQVAAAVRSQHLSGVWTVEYALELLLVGGLIPEAAWLAQSLGDWKMAASLGLAYTTYCRLHYDFSRLKWRELHLPVELQPGFIFQTQLESLLDCKASSDRQDKAFKSLPDLVEVEDMEVLHVSAQEILKASVMAEVDVVSRPLAKLLESAKEHASSFTALVPTAFYLPAPPLYCPQPSLNTQDSIGDILLALERESRCHVAAVLQQVLLLFRAAHCSRPAVQWYISGLRRCRKLFRKVRKGNMQPKDDLPEGLKKFTNRHGFFHLGSKDMDSVIIQTIVCFRELCGLCWMLHVRDQLTVSCRRYQATRNKPEDSQVTDNSMCEMQEEVLHWACRLMPFSRFLNAEETLQDLVLSLVAELPAVPLVAETLVTVFPDEEESVRVPLREKYTSLLQGLRSSTVQASTSTQDTQASRMQEEEEGVTLFLLIQEQRRQRVREGRRLAKSKIPLERHIWEREEEDDGAGASAISDRLSQCTSLSNSTLTDSERPPVVSEADIADAILSEPHSPELQNGPHHSSVSRKPQNTFKSKDGSKIVGTQQEHESLTLPSVGTWVFELEDEEYPCFLELFLSYILEKDSLDMEESELPLLISFSSCLRDRELHSDIFDILTALKRRQAGRRKGVRLPVFRAGSCFHILPEPLEQLPSVGPPPSVLGETHTARTSTGALPLPGKQPGLFSLRRQKETPLGQNVITTGSSCVRNLMERWPFKTVSCPDLDLQLELDSKLEAQFSQLARLLEWMLRWADRSVLLTHSNRKKTGGAVEPVVIRAKASAPAVLTALSLLEQRYTKALLRTDEHYTPITVPEREAEATVAPVLPLEFGWKRERVSSVDTGYPSASVGTPITLPDLDPQHGHPSEAREVEEVQDEQSLSHLGEHDDMNTSLEVKDGIVSRVNEPLPEAELDGESSIMEILEESSTGPNISVQIRMKNKTHRPRDQPLTLADLEYSKAADDSSCESPPVHEAPEPEPVQQRKQQLPSVSNPPAEPESVSHSQSVQNGENVDPNPVRQLLQDELLRLVQLQQINFMSLMQVVGASFASLPLYHAISLVPQLNVSTSLPAQPQTQPTVAQSSDPPPRDTQNTRLANKPDTVSPLQSRKPRAADQQWVEAGPGLNSQEERSRLNPQELRQLTIRPDCSQEERIHFIPPSQGLLTTIDNQAPLPTPQRNCPLEKTAPIVQGIKLLRLPPPQSQSRSPPAPVREAWGPNWYKPTTGMYRRSEHYRRRAEPTTQAQQRNLNHYSTQTQAYTISETSRREREAVHLPPAPNAAVSDMGLPLLRFPPDIQVQPIQLPRIPLPTSIKLNTAVTVAKGSFHKPQLLRVDPEPSRTGLSYSTPPRPTPRLIPLEELMAWAAGKKQDANAKLQLLKADPTTQIKLTATPSRKRHKRREDKKREEKVVSFRPDDSVIPPSQEPAEDKSTSNDGYAVPIAAPLSDLTRSLHFGSSGSFESMLAGQRLLAEAQATSAELHAFAATHKRPPEIQDACTNTDPASPRSTTDKAVSAKLPVSPGSPSACSGHVDINVAPAAPPEVFLNLPSSERMVPEQPESSVHIEPKAHARGQELISVIDVEDGSRLLGLPSSQTPVQHQSCSPPTSAQLHLLAASVTNSTQTNTEIRPDERTAESPEPSGDPITVKVLTEFGTQQEAVPEGRLVDQAFSRSQVSACISDMDARLAALQSIADHMDREFANTRLLVNTIDALTPVMMASVEEESYSSLMRATKKAKRRTARVNMDEEEEEQGERRVLSSTPNGVVPPSQRGHSSPYPASPSRQNPVHQGHVTPTVKSEQPLRDVNQELTESSMENSGLLAENLLALTGLSDVADILGDLVKDGALSPSALLRSPSVTWTRSMPEEQQRRGVMEEERKELRNWMRRKQRERLVEYHKQREEKKERERVPFTPRNPLNLSTRDLANNRKVKEEKDKAVLLEHHSQRAHEACRLITDMLTTPLILPAASNSTTKTQDSRPGSRSQFQGPVRKSPKSQRGRARSASTFGKTVVLQKRGASAPPGTLSSRFGLHRPVSALPGDRLSQVTRRGMLTDLRGRPRVKTTVQRVKTGFNKSPMELKAVRQQEESWLEDKEERDVVSPWDVPPVIRRILGLDSQAKEQTIQGLVENNDDDWLGALSESTSSILCKMDWEAIERMAAEGGDA
ncbi:ciliogenesis and planar polarity effector 1 isoform X4 [Neoarius graeffei]|uniref:ciliogenesis and planar polarity effector 1 isoform X4 n=1 Tax=Neoarius graeffei TaxID=443677 RepID=UPI00298CCDC1|nr:ciliogenesis and planar polarity effector 1 isoform X4 [Neoarius graeffei]